MMTRESSSHISSARKICSSGSPKPDPGHAGLPPSRLQSGGTLLADLRRTDFPAAVWSRFTAGREATILWYRRLDERLVEVGFDFPIMEELHEVVRSLEHYAGAGARSGRPAQPSDDRGCIPRGRVLASYTLEPGPETRSTSDGGHSAGGHDPDHRPCSAERHPDLPVHRHRGFHEARPGAQFR